MNDTQLILTALSQVPDLVEAARTYKEVKDKAINTISIAVKKQPEAIIPDSEMKKLKNSISQTQCAFPGADEFTKKLADQVYKIIALKHEHTHRHYCLRYTLYAYQRIVLGKMLYGYLYAGLCDGVSHFKKGKFDTEPKVGFCIATGIFGIHT